MGVRTRGLDIKTGAAKLKAHRAEREEAEAVVDRWNRRLATATVQWRPRRDVTAGAGQCHPSVLRSPTACTCKRHYRGEYDRHHVTVDTGHQEHRSPSTRVPTDASG
jgi:hypothetical protein